MIYVGGASWGVHVRWIKDKAIDLAILIRKISCINTVAQVRRQKLVGIRRDILPEHTLPPRYVGYFATSRDEQI